MFNRLAHKNADRFGTFHDPLSPAFFTPRFPSQPLLGRALVIGPPGPTGEETPASLTVAQVLDGIEWEREEKS
ncbi:hypothetical protein G3N59_30665 [Paraburkholderia sp. Ac-20340]|uniref:hypothetical protein n=1 Tax=Paraburkholderia sp. Ac-20340 TaxID=2703888 RepID=UPI00198214EA|nr:hypothetical protein [Paraburkholderia sp. Ac-20340]MBN3857757.1 hypothetical protein [Paraburkholderia sp. Ac-20340]